MSAKYFDMILTLSGSLGLLVGGGHQLTKCPNYLALLHAFIESCNFLTKCILEVESMGFVPMHPWKMRLKYWGMLPSQSGPLGLRQSRGYHGCGGLYKNGGNKNYR